MQGIPFDRGDCHARQNEHTGDEYPPQQSPRACGHLSQHRPPPEMTWYRVLWACVASLALGLFSGLVSARAETMLAPYDRLPTSTASPPAIAADEKARPAPPDIGETCTIKPYCCAVTCCRSGDTGTGGTPKCIEQCCAEYCEHLICK